MLADALWIGSATKDRFIPVFWVWQKRSRFGHRGIVMAALRQKPSNFLLVTDYIRQS